jgi:hypothetical protein
MKRFFIEISDLTDFPKLPENPINVEKATIIFSNGFELELNESNSKIKGENLNIYMDGKDLDLSTLK